jgi:predicted ABC-type transport system involved in lysophospholipase L1 biosynthesis ATPase subunit
VERGKTVIMVTHDHTLARRVSRVMQIVDGRLITEQPIAEGA